MAALAVALGTTLAACEDKTGAVPIFGGGFFAAVTADEPLRRELEDFVEAAGSGRPPGVTAQAGRDALALATRIAEEMEAAL